MLWHATATAPWFWEMEAYKPKKRKDPTKKSKKRHCCREGLTLIFCIFPLTLAESHQQFFPCLGPPSPNGLLDYLRAHTVHADWSKGGRLLKSLVCQTFQVQVFLVNLSWRRGLTGFQTGSNKIRRDMEHHWIKRIVIILFGRKFRGRANRYISTITVPSIWTCICI